MPIIASAKKRVRTANKAAIRNSKTKRTLKGALKAFHQAIVGGKKEAKELQSKAQSAVDTATKKGIMHKNKAARKKSQIAKAAKASTTKPAAKTVKKAVASKKTVAKKPAAKKTTKK